MQEGPKEQAQRKEQQQHLHRLHKALRQRQQFLRLRCLKRNVRRWAWEVPWRCRR